jgi:8-oxo-dGTP pyrophosphatase MutT (NUDIX family)
VQLPIPLRRQGYRLAHRLLRGWWFIARPNVHGVKCLLTNGDRILLVRHTYGHGAWDLPGGGIHRDEAPADTARREMQEELGLQLGELKPLGELHARPYRSHDRIHCFHAELSTLELTIDEGELLAAEWFPRRQLPRDVNRYVLRVLAMAR